MEAMSRLGPHAFLLTEYPEHLRAWLAGVAGWATVSGGSGFSLPFRLEVLLWSGS